MSLIEVTGVKKIYRSRRGGSSVEALKNVSFSVENGEYVAIMGESGSGKTTLLNILAALDKATSGTVLLDGMNLNSIKESKMARFRRDNLGYVFQDFNLLDTFTLEDNIFLPLVLAGKEPKEMRSRLDEISAPLGIARALITRPKMILADEPTGALDSRSSDELLDLFAKVNQMGQTILMVTHSTKAASHASRVLFIKDGIIFHQIYRGNSSDTQMYQKISDTLNLLAQGGDLA